MGQYIVGTTDAHTQLICNTSASLVGNYPNIAMRVNYTLQVRLTAYGSWYYNGFKLSFDGYNHSVNLSISFGAGGGTSGVLASGYVDYGMGGTRDILKLASFSCSGPFSGSGTWRESATIGQPSIYNLVSASNVTPFSVTISSLFSNVRNFWQYTIYDTISGIEWNPSDNKNSCSTVIGGLEPERTYNFRMMCTEPNKGYKFTSGSTYDVNVTLPADQESIFIKNNGVWKEGKVFYKLNGTWYKVKGIYIKSNGAWRKGV